jgi:hypothetical protein
MNDRQQRPRFTRRQVIGGLAALVAGAGSWAATRRSAGSEPHRVLLPLAFGPDGPLNGTLLAEPSGTEAAALSWFQRFANPANRDQLATIVSAYAAVGSDADLDWFLALAQNAHETDQLRSWWSAPPRRNPAGIGVTGETQPGSPDAAPGPDWAWDDSMGRWRRGLSFADWATEAVPAHLGRLLAYALPAGSGTAQQQQLINQALAYRPLPTAYRGTAVVITDLNGRWAVPGTTYGQSILSLRDRMRSG